MIGDQYTVHVEYRLKKYDLKAVVEYESQSIMRIRVLGMTRSLLLENNWPGIKATGSKRGIKWQIKEGYLNENGPATARLVMDIFTGLEYWLKE